MDGDDGGRSVRTETKRKGTFTTHWHDDGFWTFLNAELRERRKKRRLFLFNQQRVVNSTHNGSLDCLKPMKWRMSEKKKSWSKSLITWKCRHPNLTLLLLLQRQQLRYYWYTLTMIHWAWPSLTVAAEQEQLQHFSSTNHHDFSHHKQEEKHGVRWHARVVN